MHLPHFRYLLVAMLCSVLIVSACQKEASEEMPKKVVDKDGAAKDLAAKVAAWLGTKKAEMTTRKPGQEMKERIQSLQDNLDFSKAWYEQRNSQEKFAVIPVKEGFKSQNNKDKNPFNYLVVALDGGATITKGNLIQYLPDGERKRRQSIRLPKSLIMGNWIAAVSLPC
jgi:hypothetical protein